MSCLLYLGKKNWVFILVSALLILVGLIFIIYGAANYESEETKSVVKKKQFGVVIDAGGSGTRLYVYEYKEDDDSIDELSRIKCEGEGLTNYKKEEYPQLEVMLTKCLSLASQQYPPNKVPLYMGATAGMRLLKSTDQQTYNEIWDLVKKVLNKSGFIVKKSETITGAEEAQWAFVAANFLKKNLEGDDAKIGIAEFGSSSVQIAFVPKTVAEGATGIDSFSLNGKNISIYGHSYLCYGRKEMERRLKAKLVKDAGFAKTVMNPCDFSGDQQNLTSAYLWAEPCSGGTYAKDVLGEAFNGPANQTFSTIGTGNATECFNVLSNLINVDCTGGKTSCGINDIFQPNVAGKFLALSAFSYASSFMMVPKDVGKAEYETEWKKTCSTPIDEIMARDIPGSPPKWRGTRCFDISYSYFLLTKAFKFDNKTWDLEFTNKINGETASWALGLLYTLKKNLYSRITSDSFRIITRNSSLLILLAIGVIFLIVGIVLLVVAIMARRKAYQMPPEQATMVDA